MLIPKVEQRIRQHLAQLARRKYSRIGGLELEVLETQETHRTPPSSGAWKRIAIPYDYGREWTYYWFRGSVTIPDDARGQEVFLHLLPNADSLVYLDGKPVGAVNPFHDVLRLAAPARGGERFELHLESYAGHKYPGMHPLMGDSVILTLGAHIDDYPNRFKTAELVAKNAPLYSLFYDALALFEVAQELDANSLRRNRILSELYRALAALPLDADAGELEAGAAAASSALAPLLAARNGSSTPEIHLIGHAHIDHAWLWPMAETEHKAARTFANMARYAEEFPEFVFVQSQPVQLDIVRREYPQVFEAVRAAYARGQWEPNGGMWVEADCNLTGGESLIRQFLVGKSATREMLGYEGDTLWLPDVFGYAAALPQILAGCEIQYFVTSKINWNDTTRFPYDTFIWKGIDGTAVKTHFITSRMDGYNGRVQPRQLWDAWNQVQHKEVQDGVIKSVGEGDGGGGTRRSDLEIARRLADLEGAPRAAWIRVSEALGRIFANVERLPVWQGELYLELHRGTYTTQARTKRYNRKLEFALRECEWLYSFERSLPAGAQPLDYPRAELDACWKRLLTNQFHDIIPGSSINRVYRDAEASYAEVEKAVSALVARAHEAIAARLSAPVHPAEALGEIVAFNSLSWERDSVVRLPAPESYPDACEIASTAGGRPVQHSRDLEDRRVAYGAVSVPPMGAAAFRVVPAPARPSPFRADAAGLETPHYRVRFDSRGRIASLVDKQDGREFARAGQPLNAFQTATDVPVLWDAWDIDADWVNSLVEEDRLDSSEEISNGPLFYQLRRSYRIGERSRIVQDMLFYALDRRIDFVTKIDWHESHRLLKVAFPIDVAANQVRCEVQYGHVIRSTHDNLPSDRAQFEVCSHKWMCVEESGHGAALLNDCKYGCDVRGSLMRLTLLRSPKAPDPEADMGVHYVTYSLLPYSGSFATANVVRSAYDLNAPLQAIAAPTGAAGGREAAPRGAGAQGVAAGPERLAGLAVDNPNVVIESVKAPEPVQGGSAGASGGDSARTLIVRLYETAGGAQRANLSTELTIRAVDATNMLERDPRPCPHDARSVPLTLRPFEIKTLRLALGD